MHSKNQQKLQFGLYTKIVGKMLKQLLCQETKIINITELYKPFIFFA